MTNVSKKSLKKKVADKISNQLAFLIADFKKSDKSSLFVDEFFTETEKIMFAKRLAIIFMILEDFPSHAISKVLKVSPSTILKIAKIIDRGGYQVLKDYFKDKKTKKEFHSRLEVILRMGMPPIVGRGRWSSFYKALNKNKPSS